MFREGYSFLDLCLQEGCVDKLCNPETKGGYIYIWEGKITKNVMTAKIVTNGCYANTLRSNGCDVKKT